MCSHTSSGSYNGDPDDHSISCLKKHKKDRVPRRGPGVAELEKILRDQHRHLTCTPAASSSSPSPPPLFSSSSLHPSNLDHSLFPPPPPPPPPPLRMKPFRQLASTSTDVMPEKPHLFRPNHNVFGCDTTQAFPFPTVFSNGSFPKDMIPPPPVFQKKPHSSLQFPTMNLPHPPPPGFYQFIEPPSNQRSCTDDPSQFLEEEKEKNVIGAKRPWIFLTDTSPSTSRDAKQNPSLDLRLSGIRSGNPIKMESSSPATPSTPIRSCPKAFTSSRFFPLPLQKEDADEYMQRRKGVNVSVNQKPFYSFLPSDEQSNGDEERTSVLNEGISDPGIDLRLKL